MKRALVAMTSIAVCFLFAGFASAGPSRVLVVDDDGQDCPAADFNTIQEAVAAAPVGGKILVCSGTYQREVAITKNGLTITAKDQPGTVILDAGGDHGGFELDAVSGVTIAGFVVRHAHEADILLMAANDNVIRDNSTTMAGHDGIELVDSSRNLIAHNVSHDNLSIRACGIQVAGALSRDNVVRENLLVNNEWGVQVSAAIGTVVFHNEARGNRGNGIRNVNTASNTIIDDNRAFANGLTPGPLTGTTNAGIRIGSGTGVVVARNHAFDNLIVDLRSDVAAATFTDNHCNTSPPPGLCAHDEGEGH
jgi:parallel beta-helix repeat protein